MLFFVPLGSYLPFRSHEEQHVRLITGLLFAGLLTGCVTAPQQAQYRAEYKTRQPITAQSTWRFAVKPVTPAGDHDAGSRDLTGLFYLSEEQASTVQVNINYPAKTLHATALDAKGHPLHSSTLILLDQNAAAPSNYEYFRLTQDGRLEREWRNCTPDISVGCRWWHIELFITRQGDMAVRRSESTAGMLLLVFPFWAAIHHLEIFPHSTPVTL